LPLSEARRITTTGRLSAACAAREEQGRGEVNWYVNLVLSARLFIAHALSAM
jgi:hypothetical protein